MTVMTPMEGVAAPARAADDAVLQSSRRADGWSAPSQRSFLEAIAEGGTVDAACALVGLSAASAYAFRRSARGAAFALGWRAATLVARDHVADTLMVRALHGQVDTVTRADGSTISRHRHDNRLAMSLLARLDRQVETAADADVKAARLVAQEFDAYLDLVDRDEGPARAGLFLARRSAGLTDDPEAATTQDLAPIFALAAADRLVRTGIATAEEVDVSDLDPVARAHWTADQWQRAEAAGLLVLAGVDEDEDDGSWRNWDVDLDDETPPAPQHSQHSAMLAAREKAPVWWDEVEDEWRTRFPPPPEFDGYEDCRPADADYQRTLTPDEAELVGRHVDREDAGVVAERVRERDMFFAMLADECGEESAAPLVGVSPAGDRPDDDAAPVQRPDRPAAADGQGTCASVDRPCAMAARPDLAETPLWRLRAPVGSTPSQFAAGAPI